MQFTPDSYALREFNQCHDPKSGEFCSSGGAWFAGSKVSEPDGSPREVYHGTSHTFSGAMDFGRAGDATGAGNTVMGAFFTESYQLARDLYAGRRGKVVVAHLAIRKPLRLVDMSGFDNDLGYELRREAADYLGHDPQTAEDWQDYKGFLVRQGYDGIKFVGGGSHPRLQQVVWVAFRPDQIRVTEIEEGTAR